MAFELGDTAARELAGTPNNAELRRLDAVTLARDYSGVEAAFEARLLRLVRQCREGRAIDAGNASPAELLGACLAGR